jgi:chorismate synthase
MNTFGNLYKLTSFGESHGKAIGGVIDGCPAGIALDFNKIQEELNRRKPGQSKITTQRKEADEVEFLSGLYDGKTTGTPIAFLVWNIDQKSNDYNNLYELFRPSHADFTYFSKYGIRDPRGGGRSSARITLSRVVAGAIAKQILEKENISIHAYTSQVGNLTLQADYSTLDLQQTESNIVRCPDKNLAAQMIDLIEQVRKNQDTVGGVVSCVAKNVPVGLGEPEFFKLHSELARANLSINASKAFELGSGFSSAQMFGSQHNDEFAIKSGKIFTKTNNSGGIQGGISNGMDIYFRVAFKPVATIIKPQQTIDIKGNKVIFSAKGRHDPCVVPRAVPIVEAMTAMVLLDFYLLNKRFM